MSEDMADPKDPTLTEYENLIEELMKENEDLKTKIAELEEENKLLKYTDYAFNETEHVSIESEEKPSSRFKRSKIREKFESLAKKKEAPTNEEIPIIETETPREIIATVTDSFSKPTAPLLPKHSIVEGTSRRVCPICGNTVKATIQELADKTNIIMSYPKVYGKKYKCGQCGQEWRLPKTLE